MVGDFGELFLPFRVILDDELHRVEHRHPAWRDLVQVFAHAIFEHRILDPGIRLRHADAFGEQAEALRRVAAAARTGEGGQARVVPAGNVLVLDQLDQPALGQHDVGEIEPRKLDLLRRRALQQAVPGEALEQPVVERALVFELQRAERVRDVLQRVLDGMRVGVHRVHAPLVAGAMVRCLPDTVDGRVAQVEIGRRHVYLGAQHVLALLEAPVAHPAEQLQVLLDAAVPVGAVPARLGVRAAQRAHLLGVEAVHVGVAVLDQALRRVVHEVEVVAGVVQVRAPVKAQPFDRGDYRVDVFQLFLLRVGVVEAQVARAAVVEREPEVEADGLGVPDVEIAVRLRGKTRADPRRIRRGAFMRSRRARLAAPRAGGVLSARQIGVDRGADEVRCGRRLRSVLFRTGGGGLGHEIARNRYSSRARSRLMGLVNCREPCIAPGSVEPGKGAACRR